MEKKRNYMLYVIFAIIVTALLCGCDPPDLLPEEKPATTPPAGLSTPPPATPVPAHITGYWKSVFGDGFEIPTAAGDILYQYDDASKTLSFAGEIVNSPDLSAASGYITIRITDSGTWGKALDEYYVARWRNFADDTIEQSCAYKSGGASTMPTRAQAEAEFTVENGYFDYYGTYDRQPLTLMPVPLIFPDIFPLNAVISFASDTQGALVYTGISDDTSASVPDTWQQSTEISLITTGSVKIFARATCEGKADSDLFSAVIDVAQTFLPPAGQPGSDAIAKDDPGIVAWATGYASYTVGTECDSQWQTPELALGQAVGDSFDIVCLGNGGEITLTFDTPITNGSGPDFAVFENSFNDTFLELAYVEVSSNGTDFVRFDCVSLTASPVAAFGSVQPEEITGLASKYKQGFGTPFDLDNLRYKAEVRNGTVDLSAITHVRCVDIQGNPDSGITDYDCFGNIIYDPYRCVGSGGLDLDAVAVLNQGL